MNQKLKSKEYLEKLYLSLDPDKLKKDLIKTRYESSGNTVTETKVWLDYELNIIYKLFKIIEINHVSDDIYDLLLAILPWRSQMSLQAKIKNLKESGKISIKAKGAGSFGAGAWTQSELETIEPYVLDYYTLDDNTMNILKKILPDRTPQAISRKIYRLKNGE